MGLRTSDPSKPLGPAFKATKNDQEFGVSLDAWHRLEKQRRGFVSKKYLHQPELLGLPKLHRCPEVADGHGQGLASAIRLGSFQVVSRQRSRCVSLGHWHVGRCWSRTLELTTNVALAEQVQVRLVFSIRQ